MHTPSANAYDVIIAGAGPVGLLLACELRLAGCAVLVLEKAPDASSPLKGMPFGLRGLTPPTLESLDRRDLLDALTARAGGGEAPAAAHWRGQPRRAEGHFAGIQFFRDRIDSAAWPTHQTASVSTLAADIAGIEAVLAARAVASGVQLRRGCGVERVELSKNGVTVHAGGMDFEAGWLVGCDGGRSTVRRAAGIAFAGTDPEFTGYSVQVALAGAGKLQPGRHHTPSGMYTYAPPGTIAVVDFDGGACHRADPLTREHVEAVLRRVSGLDVEVASLDCATTWTDRAFQAATYREGRVLLAGDAAHIHSPLGGQGLNLGLGDAMNLGWKLAATIRGDAPPGLLDSYARERQPVAARILDWSRAQVALMRPDPGSRALRAIAADLIETRDGATYFAGRVWGAGLRYDFGGGHGSAGRSAPDFRLAGGGRLNEKLRTGRGVLLDFEGWAWLRRLAGSWQDRVDYALGDAQDRAAPSALLVRPDGIVAWASSEGEIAEALEQWFGVPLSA